MSSTPSIMPDVEARRLAALAEWDLLDTPQEAEFDTAVAIACRLFDCPIATISLVDDHRQWFKARVGLNNDGCAREQSLCAVAMQEPEMYIGVETRPALSRFKHSSLHGKSTLKGVMIVADHDPPPNLDFVTKTITCPIDRWGLVATPIHSFAPGEAACW